MASIVAADALPSIAHRDLARCVDKAQNGEQFPLREPPRFRGSRSGTSSVSVLPHLRRRIPSLKWQGRKRAGVDRARLIVASRGAGTKVKRVEPRGHWGLCGFCKMKRQSADGLRIIAMLVLRSPSSDPCHIWARNRTRVELRRRRMHGLGHGGTLANHPGIPRLCVAAPPRGVSR